MTAWAEYGRAVAKKRLALQIGQAEFWQTIGITQSGGSRYENGRRIPAPIRILLTVAYGSPSERKQILRGLSARRAYPDSHAGTAGPSDGSARKAVRQRRPWTEKDIKALKELASQGSTAAHIAATLKRSAAAVYTRVHVTGIALVTKNGHTAANGIRRPRF